MSLRPWQINSFAILMRTNRNTHLTRDKIVVSQDAGKAKSIYTRLKSSENHDLNAINEQIELNCKDSGQKNAAS